MRNLNILILTLLFPMAVSCKEAGSAGASSEAAASSSRQWLQVANVAEDDALNLRAAARGQANVVYRIPYDGANLLKITEQGDWTKVSYRGMQGWVYSKYVRTAQHQALSNNFGGELFCLGTEPHWNLKTRAHVAEFKKLSDKSEWVLNDIIRRGVNQTNLWMGSFTDTAGAATAIAAVFHRTENCSDGMSDENYPLSITVIDHQTQLLSGCCRVVKK
ncbi:SH3 domain-containing protein [Exilibacterium tricleocarpae]|nr:SH3 domain-containing protein [Exilibacterium tricleocarpae]